MYFTRHFCTMPYKIAIVEDKAPVLTTLVEEIEVCGGAEIVFTATNGQEYLEMMKQLQPAQYPAVVLMDIEMPVMDGIETVTVSSSLYNGVEYIMFTIFDDDERLFNALKAGAKGYLLKHERGPRVLQAVEELVERNGAPMSSSIARKMLNILVNGPRQKTTPGHPQPLLTPREIEILQGIANGLDYKQMAAKLFISPNTVRNHIANLYSKLHVTGKAQAISVAVKNKWLH